MPGSQHFHAVPPSPLHNGHVWPRAAVFDCDGLLIDTADCWRQAFARAVQRTGRELSEVLLRELSGASIRSAAKLLNVSAPVLRAELSLAFGETPIAALPGAATLVDRLRPRMPIAVATNGPQAVVSDALDRVGLRGAFDGIVSSESLDHDKPAPDVYLAACERLGVHPSDAIAFEDSAVGAQAAIAAGMTLVLVPSDKRVRVPADLRVDRLDDHRVISLLRLDAPLGNSARGRSRTSLREPDGT